jgi:hypothetical protein
VITVKNNVMANVNVLADVGNKKIVDLPNQEIVPDDFLLFVGQPGDGKLFNTRVVDLGFINKNEKGSASGVAALDASSKIFLSNLPLFATAPQVLYMGPIGFNGNNNFTYDDTAFALNIGANINVRSVSDSSNVPKVRFYNAAGTLLGLISYNPLFDRMNYDNNRTGTPVHTYTFSGLGSTVYFQVDPNGAASSQNFRVGTLSHAHASAIFDVVSTTKGALLPRMTDAEMRAIPTPAIGLLVYQTELKAMHVYDGSIWTTVGMFGTAIANRIAIGDVVAGRLTQTADFTYNTSTRIFNVTGKSIFTGVSTSTDDVMEIKSAGQYVSLIVENTSNRQASYILKSTANRWHIGADFAANSTKNFFIYDGLGARALLMINAALDVGIGGNAGTQAALNVVAAGNVGVGTNNPQALFHVSGTNVNGIEIRISNTNAEISAGGSTAATMFVTGTTGFAVGGWASVLLFESQVKNGITYSAYNGGVHTWQVGNRASVMILQANGRLGLGIAAASITARLHLAAGGTAASSGPLKLTTSGATGLTTPEDGTLEYFNNQLWFTIGSTRQQLTT